MHVFTSIYFKGYNINGNNFYKLRDVYQEMNISVNYDTATSSIVIDTTKDYITEFKPGAINQTRYNQKLTSNYGIDYVKKATLDNVKRTVRVVDNGQVVDYGEGRGAFYDTFQTSVGYTSPSFLVYLPLKQIMEREGWQYVGKADVGYGMGYNWFRPDTHDYSNYEDGGDPKEGFIVQDGKAYTLDRVTGMRFEHVGELTFFAPNSHPDIIRFKVGKCEPGEGTNGSGYVVLRPDTEMFDEEKAEVNKHWAG